MNRVTLSSLAALLFLPVISATVYAEEVIACPSSVYATDGWQVTKRIYPHHMSSFIPIMGGEEFQAAGILWGKVMCYYTMGTLTYKGSGTLQPDDKQYLASPSMWRNLGDGNYNCNRYNSDDAGMAFASPQQCRFIRVN